MNALKKLKNCLKVFKKDQKSRSEPKNCPMESFVVEVVLFQKLFCRLIFKSLIKRWDKR